MNQITIDVPEGYEWTGEVRLPLAGETYLDLDIGREVDTAFQDYVVCVRPILRSKWKPPAWLREGTWVAMDLGGNWYAYGGKPTLRPGMWSYGVESTLNLSRTPTHPCFNLTPFVPPPCTDWRTSLRQVKHD